MGAWQEMFNDGLHPDAPRVAVVGSGYVGTVVAACLAALGRQVVGLEVDPERLDTLRAGRAPFHEGGLDDLLAQAVASGRLRFTGDVAEAMGASDVVFLCVGTPSAADGHADMSAVQAAASAIGAHMERRHVLVTKSTVPIGSGHWLSSILEDALPAGVDPASAFSVVSCPEFLREGNAIEDFLHPDRVVLGSDSAKAMDIVSAVYAPVLEQSFPGGDPARRPPLVRTSLATAETVKYAANSFLATKVSFINEIANICELVGADVSEVATAIGLDSRIGDRFLDAGLGWGGSCFGKDLRALIATASAYGYEPALLRATVAVNERQRQIVLEKLRRTLKTLQGKRVALLGLAFKPGTDDLRDAPAVDVALSLLIAGARVAGHDPMVTAVPGVGITLAADPYGAAARADAVVILTDWPEYLGLDLRKLRAVMRGDLLLDGRNMLDPAAVVAAGLRYEGIGRAVPARPPSPVASHQFGEVIAWSEYESTASSSPSGKNGSTSVV